VCVSILILTLNEEKNLTACLESVAWSDDIIVFDSYSTDRTVEIAKQYGVRVVQRKFDNYGAHREAARLHVKYRYPWVLALDADERLEPELIKELQTVASDPSIPHAAYRMRRKDHFMGKWIRRSTLYPSWFLRLYRPPRIRYPTRLVHEYPIVDGTVGVLRGHLVHFSFNKGISEWVAKHNIYSEFEARETLVKIRELKLDWLGLASVQQPVRRRRALKELSFRLPCRPMLRFLYMFVWRRGFLDGWPGLTYCRLLAIYEYMIVLKEKEIERREKELPV
jgi:glycosyltransferase involved in cell wall biosynthesis